MILCVAFSLVVAVVGLGGPAPALASDEKRLLSHRQEVTIVGYLMEKELLCLAMLAMTDLVRSKEPERVGREYKFLQRVEKNANPESTEHSPPCQHLCLVAL